MEGLGRENLEAMHRRRHEVRRALDDAGLHVHNFCVVDADMVSLDPSVRGPALDRFRMGAEIASAFDAETLHLASYAPPVEISARPYALSGGAYQFEDVIDLRLPPGLDWQAVWDALVESTRFCADAAGRIVLMEPRVGEVICSVDLAVWIADKRGRTAAALRTVQLRLRNAGGRWCEPTARGGNPVA